ncbi:hypothetical protein D3C80_1762200 [compost metagenome]
MLIHWVSLGGYRDKSRKREKSAASDENLAAEFRWHGVGALQCGARVFGGWSAVTVVWAQGPRSGACGNKIVQVLGQD